MQDKLLENLVKLDRELVKKLEAARRSADRRIADAQEQSRRILNGAEIQIHQMEDEAKSRISEECKKVDENAHTRAEIEVARIHRQAQPNIELAVRFILSKVLP